MYPLYRINNILTGHQLQLRDTIILSAIATGPIFELLLNTLLAYENGRVLLLVVVIINKGHSSSFGLPQKRRLFRVLCHFIREPFPPLQRAARKRLAFIILLVTWVQWRICTINWVALCSIITTTRWSHFAVRKTFCIEFSSKGMGLLRVYPILVLVETINIAPWWWGGIGHATEGDESLCLVFQHLNINCLPCPPPYWTMPATILGRHKYCHVKILITVNCWGGLSILKWTLSVVLPPVSEENDIIF